VPFATPARLTVYDAPLDQDSITAQMRENLDDEITEVKSEKRHRPHHLASQIHPVLSNASRRCRFKVRLVIEYLVRGR